MENLRQYLNKEVDKIVLRSKTSKPEDLHLLLTRIAEFDEKQAFSVFFRCYHAKMLLLASNFVSSRETAEDIVSEVLIKLLRNRKQTFKKKNFLGFLYTCIKNQALDHIRKNKRHKFIKLDQSNIDYLVQHKSDPCGQLEGKQFGEIIYNCVESLPPKRKLVYKLIKDDRLSYKQVAKLLGISVRTVEVQLRLAVRTVKLTVDDYLACKRVR
jgi:RNA polymerase sigma-70 factor (ECF subfamily)